MLNYSLKKFSNGLRFISAPLITSEAVAVLILVKTGGRYEKPEQSGISHFIEHLFFKGSQKYPDAMAVAKELDTLGGRYNAFTGEEYTGFYIQSGANDFKKSFDLLSDMFLNPLFPEKEFEKEKGVVIEEAKYRGDIPQWHVQVLSQRQMFEGHPLGLDLSGTPETIKPITRDDVAKYFKDGYQPSSTIVAISGNPKDFDWEKEVKTKFAQAKAAKTHSPLIFKASTVSKKVVNEKKSVDQVHFVLSSYAYKRNDDRRYALSLLLTILGGGMSSRLFTKVREKRGWAYDIRSESYGFEDVGVAAITAGIKKDKLVPTVKIILEEIADLQKNGATKEELERAKSNLRGHLAISLEDSFEIASFLAEDILFEGKSRQPEEIMKKWEAVTAGEVKKVCQEVFKSARMGLAYIGPDEENEKLEKLLNSFK